MESRQECYFNVKNQQCSQFNQLGKSNLHFFATSLGHTIKRRNLYQANAYAFHQSNLYDARFELSTTLSEAKVIAREGDVQYGLNKKNEKEGEKLTQGGSVGMVEVNMKTSNAACELSFL